MDKGVESEYGVAFWGLLAVFSHRGAGFSTGAVDIVHRVIHRWGKLWAELAPLPQCPGGELANTPGIPCNDRFLAPLLPFHDERGHKNTAV